jgi:hypothetical protein
MMLAVVSSIRFRDVPNTSSIPGSGCLGIHRTRAHQATPPVLQTQRLNYDILRFVSGFFAKAVYPVFFGLLTDWHSRLLEMPVLDGPGKRAFPLQQALNGGTGKVEAMSTTTSYRLPFH